MQSVGIKIFFKHSNIILTKKIPSITIKETQKRNKKYSKKLWQGDHYIHLEILIKSAFYLKAT